MRGVAKMLNILQDFILSFLEVNAILILWSIFDIKEKKSIKNNFFIASTSSIILAGMTNLSLGYSSLFGYLSVILCVKFIYKKPLVKTAVEFFLFLIILNIFELSILGICNFIGFGNADSFIFNFASTTAVLLISITIYYFDTYNRVRLFFKLNSGILYYFLINAGTCAIVLKIVWDYEPNLILKNIPLSVIVSVSILLINLFLYNYISKITEEKKTLEIEKQYKPIMLEMLEETRRKQHDFKNYLNTINGIIEVSEESELEVALKSYINGVNTSLKKLDDIVYINNIIIKAAVYNKLNEAERMDIKFTYNITNNLLENILSDYEISDILSNLLNNAFEAMAAVEHKEKVVILNILNKNEKTVIEVMNSGKTLKPEEVENIFKRGFSTKEGKNHGYGLFNVKKIAERHKGEVEISFENEYTIFTILFK